MNVQHLPVNVNLTKFLSHPILFLLLLVACVPKSDEEAIPRLPCAISIPDFAILPSPFTPLTVAEQQTEWGREVLIGQRFTQEGDLYRAITSFKRALFLQPPLTRIPEIEYCICLSYYLGGKYSEMIRTFESGALKEVGPGFPALRELFILLYDSYRQLGDEEQASALLQTIYITFPEEAAPLAFYEAIKTGSIPEITEKAYCLPKPEEALLKLDEYKLQMKSPQRARALNAVLPGLGYAYVGQKQTALTSFVLNTLFIIAAYQFFDRGYVAAGVFTTSLEMGWYFGGIYGAGMEAESYNRLLYEKMGIRLLSDYKAFPILRFTKSF